jgi:hypothetical protein
MKLVLSIEVLSRIYSWFSRTWAHAIVPACMLKSGREALVHIQIINNSKKICQYNGKGEVVHKHCATAELKHGPGNICRSTCSTYCGLIDIDCSEHNSSSRLKLLCLHQNNPALHHHTGRSFSREPESLGFKNWTLLNPKS